MKDLELNLDTENIRVVKTTDGIDYIGRVTEQLGKLIIEKCLGVHVAQDPNNHGSFQIAFMPVIHPAVGDVDEEARGASDLEMQATAVKFQTKPNEQMLKMYKEASSGIEIAKIMPSSLS